MSTNADIAIRFIDGHTAVSSPVVSPDGSQVAFVVTRTDLTTNKYRRSIWLTPADGSTPPVPITAGDPGESSPVWSPDSRSLAFVSSRSEKKGEATIHILPMSVGEVRRVATMPDGAGSLAWSPDGRWLGFVSRTRDERYDAEDESWQAPRKIETFYTRNDGDDWIFDRPAHIYVVPADGTAAPRNLTPGPHQHSGVAWLADSSAIVTNAARHAGWDRDLASDLYIVPLDGEITALTSQTGNYGSASVSPDGQRLAFVGSDNALLYPQNTKVGVIGVAGGEHRWVSSALDRTFSPATGTAPPHWLDDGRLVASAEDAGALTVYEIDIESGTVTPITSGDQTATTWHRSSDTVAMAVSFVDRPDELHVSVNGVDTVRTTIADEFVRTAKPFGWERCSTPTADGTSAIDYWIMRPSDFDSSTTYPVLLNVHGGPFTQYGDFFFDEAQHQAAAGYIVVLGNPRGSSGRDTAWGHAILGPKHPDAPGTGWGTVDVDDVLSILDAALDHEPAADRARVGMLGGSYGGFMATWLAGTNSHRFQAICSERAVNNLLTEEWSSDIATSFRVEHGPDPVEDPDEYLRMSPMQFAKNIDVPMLLIHSENDYRCPISQADELFVTLRLLGKDVTFYRFPGESHGLSRDGSPVHRKQRAELILDFFDTHLKPPG